MNEQLDWTSEDVIIWRNFLETRTGSRLLPKLAENAPTLFEIGDTNKILVRNGKLLGFQACLSELFTLANPPPEPKQEASPYPALDKDAEWSDGQKLNTPE